MDNRQATRLVSCWVTGRAHGALFLAPPHGQRGPSVPGAAAGCHSYVEQSPLRCARACYVCCCVANLTNPPSVAMLTALSCLAGLRGSQSRIYSSPQRAAHGTNSTEAAHGVTAHHAVSTAAEGLLHGAGIRSRPCRLQTHCYLAATRAYLETVDEAHDTYRKKHYCYADKDEHDLRQGPGGRTAVSKLVAALCFALLPPVCTLRALTQVLSRTGLQAGRFCWVMARSATGPGHVHFVKARFTSAPGLVRHPAFACPQHQNALTPTLGLLALLLLLLLAAHRPVLRLPIN